MQSIFLESFVSVIRHGSIASASRYQGLSPAAVALRLKTLEDEFGVALVRRSGRTVVPTEAGVRIFKRAEAILRDMDDLRGVARGEGMVGELRLGFIASAASGIMPAMLKSFNAEHPTGRIYVQRGLSSALFNAVYESTLDAAIMVEPVVGIPKSCEWLRLNEEPLILLTDSSLAGADPHEILKTRPLVRYDRQHWGGRLAEDYLRVAGIEPIEMLELDALDSIAAMVEQGIGVSLVPDWGGPWHVNRNLVRHRLPIEGFHRNVGMMWSKGSIRVDYVKLLAGYAREACS